MSYHRAIPVIFMILLIAFPLCSGTWERTFGGIYWDGAGSVKQTSDSGFIISGYTASYGVSQDGLYLIKIDLNGYVEWINVYGGLACGGRSVQQTEDYGYISVGSCWNENYYCIKTDSLGDSVWANEYGTNYQDIAYAICKTFDGGYIIAGRTRANGDRIYVVRINSIGDTLWTRFYGSGYSEGRAIKKTIDGNYIVTGFLRINLDLRNIYLIKIDSYGDTIWTKYYGGNISCEGYDIDQTNDGGYVVIGSILLKTDSLGDSLWAKPISGIAGQQTSDGGFIILSTVGTYPATDIGITKTDSQGNIQWEQVFGGDSAEYASSIQQVYDGGYIIAGETYSFGEGRSDVYVIKTDSMGLVGVEEEQVNENNGSSVFCSSIGGNQIHFEFELQKQGQVNLGIYDLSGRLISTPLNGLFSSGRHQIDVNLPGSGMYFYEFNSVDFKQKGKIIIL
ncbi:MAG: hypothetical protein APR63_13925 [Desulfuromonas sp. SDB]|nr:MAG: hypothetical protein APR63_13925 [Desulfuromonas sp. SDB]